MIIMTTFTNILGKCDNNAVSRRQLRTLSCDDSSVLGGLLGVQMEVCYNDCSLDYNACDIREDTHNGSS